MGKFSVLRIIGFQELNINYGIKNKEIFFQGFFDKLMLARHYI
jgi:hypothetical protein